MWLPCLPLWFYWYVVVSFSSFLARLLVTSTEPGRQSTMILQGALNFWAPWEIMKFQLVPNTSPSSEMDAQMVPLASQMAPKSSPKLPQIMIFMKM